MVSQMRNIIKVFFYPHHSNDFNLIANVKQTKIYLISFIEINTILIN